MYSDCELTIELDKSEPRYQAGETISGCVKVEVNEDVTCDGLNLSWYWKTHGSGDVNKGETTTRTLFEGQFRKGETREYPFELEAPEHPLTYHGKHVNVDWYLKATADIPWALDPKAETDIIVEENSSTPPRKPPGTGHEQEVRTTGSILSMGFQFLFGPAFLYFGLTNFFEYFTKNVSGGNGWVALFMGILFSGIGVKMLYDAIHNIFANFMARQALDDLQVDVEPSRVTPGDSVQCRVEMTPDSQVTLNGINLTLKAFERAVDHHGSDSTTYTDTILTSSHELPDADGTYRKGTTVEFAREMTVPEDAPPTFEAEDNEIKWHCQINIDIDDWPDWEGYLPVEVVR